MKKLISGLIIVFAFLLLTSVSNAETNFGREVKETISETVEEGQNEGLSPAMIRKEARENVKNLIQVRKEGLLESVKNFIKKNLRFDARLTCTIATLDTESFTVDCDGETYTINVSDQTRFVRRFGGKSSFSELKVGDEVNIFGKFTDETKTAVDAKLIRDLSIQRRWGVFFGEVLTLPNGESFTMKTIQRGDLTVFYDGETEFLNHKKEVIAAGDVEVGMRLRVKGVWDKTANEVRETEEIRVFPAAPTETPTPTP